MASCGAAAITEGIRGDEMTPPHIEVDYFAGDDAYHGRRKLC